MKVSGFTFLKNASLLGYPFIESITSALPLVDEFVVAVGECEDDTLAQLEAIASDKLRIIQTQWNEKMADRGYVYAQQKMIAQFNCTGDWAFYLEADEVLHERDYDTIRNTMQRYLDQPQVEALIFDYHHFFGSSDWLAISPGWYRRAPRIIRNTLRSYAPDGLFFVVMEKNKRGRYPQSALAGGTIFHYGHVRKRTCMEEKMRRVSKYWGNTDPGFKHYAIDPEALARFTGDHPAVMQDWLNNEAEQDFLPDPDHTLTRRERKHRWMMKLEKQFGIELSKKHYKLIKEK